MYRASDGGRLGFQPAAVFLGRQLLPMGSLSPSPKHAFDAEFGRAYGGEVRTKPLAFVRQKHGTRYRSPPPYPVPCAVRDGLCIGISPQLTGRSDVRSN